MNAAFLLVTTAWLAGADADKPAPPAAHHPPAPAACSTYCDPCCEKEGLLQRFCNLFKRKDCCDPCCTPCPKPCPPPCPKPCPPPCKVTCTTTCDDCCEEGFLKKLLNRFRCRKCDDCCNPCCTAPPHHPKAEPIPPPKDGGKPMPKGGDKPGTGKPDGGEVQSIPQPVNPPALEVAPRSNYAPNPF